MNWGIIITLIMIGIIGLALEFLIIPGGIVGVISAIVIAGGVVMSYVQYGPTAGNITLISTMVLTIVSIILLLRSKTWKKLMLNTKIESKVNEIDNNKIKVGMTGVSVSRLAPSGKAMFDGEIVEVFSMQNFIDENLEIVIMQIEGNKIIVKLK